MSSADAERMLKALRALADETRLRIMGALAGGARNAGSLAVAVDRSAGTISHHMARLAAAGLVRMRQEGTVHWFERDEAALERLGQAWQKPAGPVPAHTGSPPKEAPAGMDASAPPETAPPATSWTSHEREVIAAFAPGGRLRALPVSRKNRECVLRWVMTHFARDKSYDAAALAAALERLALDPHTLRRTLLSEGWIEQAAGGYRVH